MLQCWMVKIWKNVQSSWEWLLSSKKPRGMFLLTSLGLKVQLVVQFQQTSSVMLVETNIYIYMSYGRNYLFGEYAITKCGGSPIGFQGFGRSGHQHQNKSMRFTVWDDLICYMIENCRRASQDARVPFDSTCRYNYKIFECALVHLGCTYSRHLWKHEKEDSTFFGSQQGQQTMNFELWSKPFLPQSGM